MAHCNGRAITCSMFLAKNLNSQEFFSVSKKIFWRSDEMYINQRYFTAAQGVTIFLYPEYHVLWGC